MQELIDKLNNLMAQQAEISSAIAETSKQLNSLGFSNLPDIYAANLHHKVTAAGWDMKELVSSCRRDDLVVKRAICYDYLKRKGMTLKFIGRIFGGRHHTTVLHGLCLVHDMKTTDYYAYETFKAEFYGEQKL